jgi:hypothetical protein
MDPIRAGNAPPMLINLENDAEPMHTVSEMHPSGYATTLKFSMLSNRTMAALSAKEKQGDEHEKTLAIYVKQAMGTGLLKISPNQRANSNAQFGMQPTLNSVIAVKATLNERLEYDILSIGLKRDGEAPIFTLLLAPAHRPPTRPASVQHKSRLLLMPLELQQSVMQQVLTGTTKRQGVYDLSALQGAAKPLKITLAENFLLSLKHEMGKKIIGAVNNMCADDLVLVSDTILFELASPEKKEACVAVAIEDLHPDSIDRLGRAMVQLEPDQRKRLVYAILNAQFDDLLDSEDRLDNVGILIGSLGAGMHTIAEHHNEILNTILRLPDPSKCWAIHGLGKGLSALNPEWHEPVLQAALEIEEQEYRSEAISGLTEGMSVLTENQSSSIFEAAILINDDDFSDAVIPGLCKGIQGLTIAQQSRLADLVSRMTLEANMVESIICLGPALKDVKGNHCLEMLEKLINVSLSMISEENRAISLGSLAAGLGSGIISESGSAEQFVQLLSNLFGAVMALADEGNKSKAIAGFGLGLRLLSSHQKHSLIDTCLGMATEKNRCQAIAGLGVGLKYLDNDQRKKVLNSSLIMAEDLKACAIMGLGRAITAFDARQQARLVDVAIQIGPQYRGGCIVALSGVEDLVQYSLLVNAALSLPLDQRVGGQSPYAIALASLAKRDFS